MEFFETIKFPKPGRDTLLVDEFMDWCKKSEKLVSDLQDQAYWRGVEVGAGNKQEMVDALKKLAHTWTDSDQGDDVLNGCAEELLEVIG